VSQDKSLNYTSYLALEEILGAQRPKSDEHDEILFIVVHQVYELWFKQLIHELRYLQQTLEEGHDARAFATFKRLLTILKLIVAQLDVIETMTPVQFLSFRELLESSSGFQSGQFRELEAILGRRDPGVLTAYHEGSVDYGKVKAALERPSVYDSFLRYLSGKGYDVPAEALERADLVVLLRFRPLRAEDLLQREVRGVVQRLVLAHLASLNSSRAMISRCTSDAPS